MRETLWKKFLNFVKDVRMIYVNFTVIVITVPEKKIIGGITVIPPSHIQCIYIYDAHYQISHV